MNNNNRGNNRRRGRNNRAPGGGQPVNRIDSRARGNAPQMLDKYKKMAEESHRNGDRVQAEYYLQFADHYFRVIADGKVRQDEQRQRRDGERFDRNDNDSDGDNDREGERESEGYTQDLDNERDAEIESAERAQRRNDRDAESESSERPRRRNDSAEENPFTRDNRDNRESRPRRPRRPREDEGGSVRSETEEAVRNDGSLDPQALPPAIGEIEDKPKRRGRPRKVKPDGVDDGADVKQAVNG
ncbi:DUF4167 domain-containing protein [Croceicoccus ponticola]|uniref:DUF4167 domain-containing protein n=1 Tax=Croceicoccus ponticola TaxID=2217664 RepID=A0A437GY15_9SPHN|nr:DUF4167 domain-containing protein [Croceicoccus ponticola]RVQ67563.1 DUF4167 domain-containing protein [Croceicoccus ponticola]